MYQEKFIDRVSDAPVLYTAARDNDIPPGTVFGPVVRDIYVIECCIAGRGSVIIDDKEFFFEPGDSYVLLPGQKIVHTADPKESRVCLWCAIDGRAVEEAVTAFGITSDSPFAPRECFSEMSAAILRMIEMKDDTDMGADFRRIGCIYELLGAMTRARSTGNKNMWVDKAIGYMTANYHLDISVEDIAAEVGLERCYFSTLFKSRTGSSPHAYLSELRIRKAAALMRDRGYLVADAAEAVGLDSQNFARLFRKIIGINPKDFKSNAQKIENTKML